MQIFQSKQEILGAVGTELGSSDWWEITQESVNLFSEATGDHQWIHVDVERAQRESPFGGPIAHGYLTLSLLPVLGGQIYRIENTKMGINYGANKVRFPAPVRVGSKVRSTASPVSASEVDGEAVQLVVAHTVETDGGGKPALVAEVVSRVVF